ncbi:MAG: acylphosphatase [Synechococcales cyanobacterium T60_A2020_003]|nr:acylphosphatase [Synechococcales cyanobacterium T60_A2020_003]
MLNSLDSSGCSDIVRVHIFVSGRVQRVGYRFSTCDQAAVLNVNGWVRNLHDGRVEAVFEGSKVQIQEMLRWCRKGPPSAIVQDVRVEYEPPAGLDGFQIIR